MRLYTISILLIVAFVMNGCLVDRIKQRMQARELMKQRQLKEVETFEKPKLYKPSPSPLKEESRTTVVKKKSKKIKKIKKRVKTKVKKKKHTPKKVVEPYSIEKDEADPELLGPQTTLKSNPLTKKAQSTTTNKM